MDRMSFGEKKVFTIPKNVTVFKEINIDEDDRRLVTASLNDKFSQLVSILMLFNLSHTKSLKSISARNLILKVPR